MTPDRDSRLTPPDQPDDEFDDEDPPRSILSATWFRVVLVGIVLVIVGALAVPYVMDFVNPPAPPFIASAPRGTTPAPARPTTPPAPAASAPAPTSPPTTTAPGTASASPMASTPVPPPAISGAPVKPKEVAAAQPESKPAPVETAKPLVSAKKEAEPAPKAAERPAPASTSKETKETTAAPTRVAAAKEVPAPAAERRAKPAEARAAATEGGDWFVQVGAFKDQETSRRVAARLRSQNYPVEESVKRVGGGAAGPIEAPRPAPRASAPTAPGADRYDVIVTGGPPAEINTKLAAKGLAAEAVGDGVRIRPSLPLRDAVALSKDLNNDGFKVQVRRGGGAAGPVVAAAPPPRASTAGDGDGGGASLYRVRVGGYPDRATAATTARALQAKGYETYIAKGRE